MSTVRANQFLDAAGGNTAQINGMTPTAQSLQGFRNRIINGNMVIDQRNNGASVTPTDGQYTLDRWNAGLTQASKFSVQRSTVAPAGYTNSLLVTSLSAYSVGSGDLFRVSQYIEGFNVADLGWGAAGAQSVTLSFWVRSSLTGTFSGALLNSSVSRSYPFTFSISAANTWEQKSVTIAGDTTGTWLTDNGIGIRVGFSLGAGSSFSGTAGAWSGSAFTAATGAVSVVGTNGATFFITGVQLEAGSVATPFEQIDYGRELIMCQRYYYQFDSSNGYVATGSYRANTTTAEASFLHPVTMRASPSIAANAGAFNIYSTTGAPLSTSVTVIGAGTRWAWVSSGVGLAVGTQGTGAMFYMASGQVMTVNAEL
jgi:hypothetical protein